MSHLKSELNSVNTEQLLDRLITEWFYRLPKGYARPPYTSNELKALEKAVMSLELKQEEKQHLSKLAHPIVGKVITEGCDEIEQHDQAILDKLGEIPKVKGTYSIPGSGGIVKVKGPDLENWKKIYPIAPKKGKGTDKTIGNGEVALYWLFRYQKNQSSMSCGSTLQDADLVIDGTSVEVKAYDKKKGKIPLGRFGQDRESLKKLTIVFGIYSLIEEFTKQQKEKSTIISPTNFYPENLKNAFDTVFEFKSIANLEKLANTYDLFARINYKITKVLSRLGNPKDSQEATNALISQIVKTKIGKKPGDGQFMAILDGSGEIAFYKTDYAKLEKADLTSRDNVSTTQSFLKLNFNNIFGN